MNAAQPTSVRRLVWPNILFFSITTLIALIGGPLYYLRYGISAELLVLMAFYMVVTGMSITVGYHRLFAHRNFKANAILRFLVLFFGAGAYEQSALKWSAQHRDHHKYVDTDRDPYSIKKGFWYAHIGWMVFWDHVIPYENAKDLQEDRLVMHQHKYYPAWSVVSGIALPILIGALFGQALGAAIFAVCVRLTFVYHTTFCINSVCHTFGKATYDIYASARDHWFVALLTFGEGYHNFHHRFPTDYRNGVRWYHWDPSKWTIALLTKIGWVRDIKTVSHFRILDAKLAAAYERTQNRLKEMADRKVQRDLILKNLTVQYQKARVQLGLWEKAARDYQSVMVERLSRQSAELKEKARSNMLEARQRFQLARDQWKSIQLQYLGVCFS